MAAMKKSPLFLLVLALALPFFPSCARAHTGFQRDTAVFIGSSTMELWKTMHADFAPRETVNLGRGGTTFGYLVENAGRWAESYPARTYVVYSGDNDIAWNSSPESVMLQFRLLAETLRGKIPDVEIYLLAIKPCLEPQRRALIAKVREANKALRLEAARLGYVTYVDVHTPMLDVQDAPRPELFQADGVHLSDEGYRLWTDTLKRQLR